MLATGNEGVADLVALTAVHEHLGVVMTTAELARALGVKDEEAAARITALTNQGYLSLPIQSRSAEGEWSAIGVRLTARGRDLLGVE